MFEISIKKLDLEEKNKVIKRNINLDTNLDCFILVSSDSDKLTENLVEVSLDSLVDKISKNNTYEDFSIALENINAYLKTWRKDSEKVEKVNMIIWILNENNYIFSNIWNSSSYMVNKNSEVIELTNKWENKDDFSFISSWSLINGDIVVSSTIELFDYISKSDLIDWLVLSEDIEIFNKNIKNILKSEIIWENLIVSSLKFTNKKYVEKESYFNKINESAIKIADTKIIKLIIQYFFITKNKLAGKINLKSKKIYNIFISIWIILAFGLLFTTLSKFIETTTQTENKQESIDNLTSIKTFVRLASENIENFTTFEENIKNAEILISELETKEMFINDLVKLKEDINILKKQFNKIDLYEAKDDNLVFSNLWEKSVKIVYVDEKNINKTYIINEKSIVWPFISQDESKIYTFDNLKSDDKFIDAITIWEDIFLLTSKSKIVNFSKWYFSYFDVNWQETWWNIKNIENYAQNLYTLDNDNQIKKFSLSWWKFKTWVDYLENDDLNQIWEILSIWIDWWIYILKKDLSMIKYYWWNYWTWKNYKLESLSLNKLPENYNIEENDSKIEIKSWQKYNYLYLLLNNKIWVFEPNSTNYQNTISLTYIWQIEWVNKKILDFQIINDSKIYVLFEDWIHELNFEVSWENILIK